MICPMHEEKTPSFMYNKKTGDFYCFGCGVQPEFQNFGDALHAVEFCIDYDPMLCEECWIPALLDRGKRIQCQNCGCEFERDNPSEECHKEFRKMVEKRYSKHLRPFSKSL